MKIRICTIAIAALLVLNGCGIVYMASSEPPQSSPPVAAISGSSAEPSLSPMASAATETPSDTAPPSVQPSPSYSIKSEVISENNILIQYPQIQGLEDEAAETTVNALIKQNSLAAFDWFDEPAEVESETFESEYHVTLSTDQFLSIMCTGFGYTDSGFDPYSVFYGITIDLKTGSRLYLPDFIQIDESLIDRIIEADAIALSVDSAYVDGDDLFEVQQWLETDREGINKQVKSNGESNFCITPDSLIIGLDVSHHIGDVVFVEIPGQYKVISNQTSPIGG